MQRMFGDIGRMASLRKVALACAVLVLAITSLSAFLRLSASGLGCEPWPQCYGQSLRDRQQGAVTPPTGVVTAARISHRIAAVAALLLIIVMVMNTWSKTPVLRREGTMVLGLLFLALFLAILGRWTANAKVPAVVLGNLVGGFAMFALSCRLVESLTPGPVTGRAPVSRWAWAAVALLVVQVALGGMVNATYAGLSCPDLFRCDMAGASWQALNPWQVPAFDPAAPTNPSGALVQWLHRIGALAVFVVLLPLGIVSWRRGHLMGAALLVLLAVEAVLGVMLVRGALALPAALAHNIVAALLLAATLSLAAGRGRGSAA
ncbi:MAG: cytochrome oxidase assembly protein [Ramlibacter sp.]|nr:cytochrome oxidase assembly protein [Ramlibacter sp.]